MDTCEETYQRHDSAHSSTTPADLGLDQEFHDGHSSTTDGILFVSVRGPSGRIEQLRRFCHSERDHVGLGASSSSGEFLQDLHRFVRFWHKWPGVGVDMGWILPAKQQRYPWI